MSLHLKGMPKEDVQQIFEEFKEYFNEAKQKGYTEKEIVKSLGHPLEIAKNYKENSKENLEQTNISQFRSIIVALGLIFFNLTVVLGLVLGAAGTILGLFFACFVMVISPILVIFKMYFGSGHWFELLISFILSGIGFLAIPYFSIILEKGKTLLEKYIHWNVKVVKGEGV